jgi:molecular chaperone DnaK (HSP70)
VYVLGIDVGTTFTAAATWRDGYAEIVGLGSRAASIPSVVMLRDDDLVLTGEAASRRAPLHPERVAREFKRRLGDRTPIVLGGTPFPAESLMAELLGAVITEVTSRERGTPSAACLCHPANWGPHKVDVLRQAAAMASLRAPLTMATEPAAAATYYARQTRIDPGSMVAVYDLGGGTFDTAVLRKTSTGFEIIGNPQGIDHFGGVDFDGAIFHVVCARIGLELETLDFNDPAMVVAIARLRDECTKAKETLSWDTDVTIPVLLPNVSAELRLTRDELEGMLRPALYDTIEVLLRAISSAGIAPTDLHSVLLTGGSSRMPLVAQVVGAELLRPVAVDAHPKHAVALGAAWLAAEHLHLAQTLPASLPPSRSESPDHVVAPMGVGSYLRPAPTSSARLQAGGPVTAQRPRRARHGPGKAGTRLRWMPHRVGRARQFRHHPRRQPGPIRGRSHPGGLPPLVRKWVGLASRMRARRWMTLSPVRSCRPSGKGFWPLTCRSRCGRAGGNAFASASVGLKSLERR